MQELIRKRKSFRGGVHPAGFKDSTDNKALRPLPVPPRVRIPLIQHIGAPCAPCVAPGDHVKTGQRIGDADSFITSPVHASVTGTVRAITESPHPVLGKASAVEIESDTNEEWVARMPLCDSLTHIGKMAPERVRESIRNAGIVGLGGAAFPSHVKLASPKKIDTVLLNGAECEPFLTCDYRLMKERAFHVLSGLRIIMHVLGVATAYVAVESNKKDLADDFTRAYAELKDLFTGESRVIIAVVPTKYPQGSEKQLIEVLTGRKVPPRSLPLDVACVVHNVGTACAIYEAVCEGKPLVRRALTVTGDCVKEPGNWYVRLGTSFSYLMDQCGAEKDIAAKIIHGGPMMGIAQMDPEVPVIKGTSGALFLSEAYARWHEEKPCIQCARCVDACPMNLLPLLYAKYTRSNKWEKTEEYAIDDCMECGSCSFVCPARIPLVQYIKTAKYKLSTQRKKAKT